MSGLPLANITTGGSTHEYIEEPRGVHPSKGQYLHDRINPLAMRRHRDTGVMMQTCTIQVTRTRSPELIE